MKLKFESNTAYYCKHRPTGEEWLVIGVSTDGKKVCAAGYPPSIADVSDCEAFTPVGPLTKDQLDHRLCHFGKAWI